MNGTIPWGTEALGKDVLQWQTPKHPRKFHEKFKHQMVKLYDNGKPTS